MKQITQSLQFKESLETGPYEDFTLSSSIECNEDRREESHVGLTWLIIVVLLPSQWNIVLHYIGSVLGPNVAQVQS